MIQAAGFPLNVTYAEKISRQYAAKDAAGGAAAAQAMVDSVTLSPAGQAMNAAVSTAVNGGTPPQPLKPGGLQSLPEWSFNYQQAAKRAEAGLTAALQQLGIPAGTKVSMTVNSDGTITVASGSARNAELEALVNNNPELRNAVVAAQNAAYLGRIGDAVGKAQAAMDATPAKANFYNSWLLGATQRIMSLGFSFDYADGKLSGAFLSGERKLGLLEGLESPPA